MTIVQYPMYPQFSVSNKLKIWDGDKTYLDLFFQDIRLLVEELQCSFLQLFSFLCGLIEL